MITATNILELIPQRPPFIFVDKLSGLENPVNFQSELTIRNDNPLLVNEQLVEAGLVEFVAQSIAAHIGFEGGDEVKIGVIGSIKKFVVNHLPALGQTIHARLIIINKVFNMTLVEARIYCDDREIGFCEMKVAVAD